MRQALRELRAEQRFEAAAQLNSVDPDEAFGERPLLPVDFIAFERRSFENGLDEPTKNETAGVLHDTLDSAHRYGRESSNEELAIVWLTTFERLPGCLLEGWDPWQLDRGRAEPRACRRAAGRRVRRRRRRFGEHYRKAA